MSDEIVGAATSEGSIITPDMKRRELPPKQWRKHRWVGIAAYVLSEEQAEAGHAPGNQVMLDGSNLFTLTVGCYDCERPYVEVHGQRCSVAR